MAASIAIPNLSAPIDDEGYTVSFTYDDDKGFIEFFNTYGFVVIRDVLTPEACDATVSEIYDILEGKNLRGAKKYAKNRFDRRDRSTWQYWPEGGIEHYGSMQRASIFSNQFVQNRQNPKIHAVWAKLLGDDRLIINHDRACFFRPTCKVPDETGNTTDRPKWKTRANLHLDLNPSQYLHPSPKLQHGELDNLTYDRINNFINENNAPHKSDKISCQGSLNLLDNRDYDGGFQCVPGFHTIFDDYFRDFKNPQRPSVSFPRNSPIHKYGQRISSRKGSMIIWNQTLPHGSLPNNSTTPRVAQFIRLFRESELTRSYTRTKKRAAQVRKYTSKQPVSPLGKILFGYEADANM